MHLSSSHLDVVSLPVPGVEWYRCGDQLLILSITKQLVYPPHSPVPTRLNTNGGGLHFITWVHIAASQAEYVIDRAWPRDIDMAGKVLSGLALCKDQNINNG